MAEKLEWKADYTVGIEEIDFQHQYFVKLINRLMKELTDAKDDSYSARLMEELSRYASFHFVSEENIMLRFGYPNLEEHKEYHLQLINQLNEKIYYFKNSEISQKEIINFLIDWFVSHTIKLDKEFGRFVAEGEE